MMFEFVLMVVLFNAIMLACMYSLRNMIAVRSPVLFIAVGISVFYCILYPFLVSRVTYPNVLYIYALLVAIGAAVICVTEIRFFSIAEPGDNEVAGITVGGAMAVAEGKSFSLSGVTEQPGHPPFKSGASPDSSSSILVPDTSNEAPVRYETDKSENTRDIITTFEEDKAVVEEDKITWGGDDAEDTPVLQDQPDAERVAVDGKEHPSAATKPEIPSASEAVDGPGAGSVSEINQDSLHFEGAAVSGGKTNHRELTGDSQISIMVASAFNRLVSGDSAGAVEGFFRVLKTGPPPKLAVMLCIEISSIYLNGGHKRQALAVLEMLEVVWGHTLDPGDAEEVSIKIKLLRGEIL